MASSRWGSTGPRGSPRGRLGVRPPKAGRLAAVAGGTEPELKEAVAGIVELLTGAVNEISAPPRTSSVNSVDFGKDDGSIGSATTSPRSTSLDLLAEAESSSVARGTESPSLSREAWSIEPSVSDRDHSRRISASKKEESGVSEELSEELKEELQERARANAEAAKVWESVSERLGRCNQCLLNLQNPSREGKMQLLGDDEVGHQPSMQPSGVTGLTVQDLMERRGFLLSASTVERLLRQFQTKVTVSNLRKILKGHEKASLRSLEDSFNVTEHRLARHQTRSEGVAKVQQRLEGFGHQRERCVRNLNRRRDLTVALVNAPQSGRRALEAELQKVRAKKRELNEAGDTLAAHAQRKREEQILARLKEDGEGLGKGPRVSGGVRGPGGRGGLDVKPHPASEAAFQATIAQVEGKIKAAMTEFRDLVKVGSRWPEQPAGVTARLEKRIHQLEARKQEVTGQLARLKKKIAKSHARWERATREAKNPRIPTVAELEEVRQGLREQLAAMTMTTALRQSKRRKANWKVEFAKYREETDALKPNFEAALLNWRQGAADNPFKRFMLEETLKGLTTGHATDASGVNGGPGEDLVTQSLLQETERKLDNQNKPLGVRWKLLRLQHLKYYRFLRTHLRHMQEAEFITPPLLLSSVMHRETEQAITEATGELQEMFDAVEADRERLTKASEGTSDFKNMGRCKKTVDRSSKRFETALNDVAKHIQKEREFINGMLSEGGLLSQVVTACSNFTELADTRPFCCYGPTIGMPADDSDEDDSLVQEHEATGGRRGHLHASAIGGHSRNASVFGSEVGGGAGSCNGTEEAAPEASRAQSSASMGQAGEGNNSSVTESQGTVGGKAAEGSEGGEGSKESAAEKKGTFNMEDLVATLKATQVAANAMRKATIPWMVLLEKREDIVHKLKQARAYYVSARTTATALERKKFVQELASSELIRKRFFAKVRLQHQTLLEEFKTNRIDPARIGLAETTEKAAEMEADLRDKKALTAELYQELTRVRVEAAAAEELLQHRPREEQAFVEARSKTERARLQAEDMRRELSRIRTNHGTSTELEGRVWQKARGVVRCMVKVDPEGARRLVEQNLALYNLRECLGDEIKRRERKHAGEPIDPAQALQQLQQVLVGGDASSSSSSSSSSSDSEKNGGRGVNWEIDSDGEVVARKASVAHLRRGTPSGGQADALNAAKNKLRRRKTQTRDIVFKTNSVRGRGKGKAAGKEAADKASRRSSVNSDKGRQSLRGRSSLSDTDKTSSPEKDAPRTAEAAPGVLEEDDEDEDEDDEEDDEDKEEFARDNGTLVEARQIAAKSAKDVRREEHMHEVAAQRLMQLLEWAEQNLQEGEELPDMEELNKVKELVKKSVEKQVEAEEKHSREQRDMERLLEQMESARDQVFTALEATRSELQNAGGDALAMLDEVDNPPTKVLGVLEKLLGEDAMDFEKDEITFGLESLGLHDDEEDAVSRMNSLRLSDSLVRRASTARWSEQKERQKDLEIARRLSKLAASRRGSLAAPRQDVGEPGPGREPAVAETAPAEDDSASHSSGGSSYNAWAGDFSDEEKEKAAPEHLAAADADEPPQDVQVLPALLEDEIHDSEMVASPTPPPGSGAEGSSSRPPSSAQVSPHSPQPPQSPNALRAPSGQSARSSGTPSQLPAEQSRTPSPQAQPRPSSEHPQQPPKQRYGMESSPILSETLEKAIQIYDSEMSECSEERRKRLESEEVEIPSWEDIEEGQEDRIQLGITTASRLQRILNRARESITLRHSLTSGGSRASTLSAISAGAGNRRSSALIAQSVAHIILAQRAGSKDSATSVHSLSALGLARGAADGLSYGQSRKNTRERFLSQEGSERMAMSPSPVEEPLYPRTLPFLSEDGEERLSRNSSADDGDEDILRRSVPDADGAMLTETLDTRTVRCITPQLWQFPPESTERGDIKDSTFASTLPPGAKTWPSPAKKREQLSMTLRPAPEQLDGVFAAFRIFVHEFYDDRGVMVDSRMDYFVRRPVPGENCWWRLHEKEEDCWGENGCRTVTMRWRPQQPVSRRSEKCFCILRNVAWDSPGDLKLDFVAFSGGSQDKAPWPLPDPSRAVLSWKGGQKRPAMVRDMAKLVEVNEVLEGKLRWTGLPSSEEFTLTFGEGFNAVPLSLPRPRRRSRASLAEAEPPSSKPSSRPPSKPGSPPPSARSRSQSPLAGRAMQPSGLPLGKPTPPSSPRLPVPRRELRGPRRRAPFRDFLAEFARQERRQKRRRMDSACLGMGGSSRILIPGKAQLENSDDLSTSGPFPAMLCGFQSEGEDLSPAFMSTTDSNILSSPFKMSTSFRSMKKAHRLLSSGKRVWTGCPPDRDHTAQHEALLTVSSLSSSLRMRDLLMEEGKGGEKSQGPIPEAVVKAVSLGSPAELRKLLLEEAKGEDKPQGVPPQGEAEEEKKATVQSLLEALADFSAGPGGEVAVAADPEALADFSAGEGGEVAPADPEGRAVSKAMSLPSRAASTKLLRAASKEAAVARAASMGASLPSRAALVSSRAPSLSSTVEASKDVLALLEEVRAASKATSRPSTRRGSKLLASDSEEVGAGSKVASRSSTRQGSKLLAGLDEAKSMGTDDELQVEGRSPASRSPTKDSARVARAPSLGPAIAEDALFVEGRRVTKEATFSSEGASPKKDSKTGEKPRESADAPAGDEAKTTIGDDLFILGRSISKPEADGSAEGEAQEEEEEAAWKTAIVAETPLSVVDTLLKLQSSAARGSQASVTAPESELGSNPEDSSSSSGEEEPPESAEGRASGSSSPARKSVSFSGASAKSRPKRSKVLKAVAHARGRRQNVQLESLAEIKATVEEASPSGSTRLSQLTRGVTKQVEDAMNQEEAGVDSLLASLDEQWKMLFPATPAGQEDKAELAPGGDEAKGAGLEKLREEEEEEEEEKDREEDAKEESQAGSPAKKSGRSPTAKRANSTSSLKKGDSSPEKKGKQGRKDPSPEQKRKAKKVERKSTSAESIASNPDDDEEGVGKRVSLTRFQVDLDWAKRQEEKAEAERAEAAAKAADDARFRDILAQADAVAAEYAAKGLDVEREAPEEHKASKERPKRHLHEDPAPPKRDPLAFRHSPPARLCTGDLQFEGQPSVSRASTGGTPLARVSLELNAEMMPGHHSHAMQGRLFRGSIVSALSHALSEGHEEHPHHAPAGPTTMHGQELEHDSGYSTPTHTVADAPHASPLDALAAALQEAPAAAAAAAAAAEAAGSSERNYGHVPMRSKGGTPSPGGKRHRRRLRDAVSPPGNSPSETAEAFEAMQFCLTSDNAVEVEPQATRRWPLTRAGKCRDLSYTCGGSGRASRVEDLEIASALSLWCEGVGSPGATRGAASAAARLPAPDPRGTAAAFRKLLVGSGGDASPDVPDPSALGRAKSALSTTAPVLPLPTQRAASALGRSLPPLILEATRMEVQPPTRPGTAFGAATSVAATVAGDSDASPDSPVARPTSRDAELGGERRPPEQKELPEAEAAEEAESPLAELPAPGIRTIGRAVAGGQRPSRQSHLSSSAASSISTEGFTDLAGEYERVWSKQALSAVLNSEPLHEATPGAASSGDRGLAVGPARGPPAGPPAFAALSAEEFPAAGLGFQSPAWPSRALSPLGHVARSATPGLRSPTLGLRSITPGLGPPSRRPGTETASPPYLESIGRAATPRIEEAMPRAGTALGLVNPGSRSMAARKASPLPGALPPAASRRAAAGTPGPAQLRPNAATPGPWLAKRAEGQHLAPTSTSAAAIAAAAARRAQQGLKLRGLRQAPP